MFSGTDTTSGWPNCLDRIAVWQPRALNFLPNKVTVRNTVGNPARYGRRTSQHFPASHKQGDTRGSGVTNVSLLDAFLQAAQRHNEQHNPRASLAALNTTTMFSYNNFSGFVYKCVAVTKQNLAI